MDPESWSEKPCDDPRAEILVVPYVLGVLDTEERCFFEAHVLGCDACYGSLSAIERTSRLLTRFLDSDAGKYLERLRKQRSGMFSLRRLLDGEF
jgi:hypothetical protein